MHRSIANIMEDLAMRDRVVAGYRYSGDEARYGADLLGNAIGHEMAYERRTGLPETMFYSNLIHATDHTATRKIMAFTAAREVMALTVTRKGTGA